jgi:tetratricopeptide (TPR) repeat protein
MAAEHPLKALEQLSEQATQNRLGTGQVWQLRGHAYSELGRYEEALSVWAYAVEALGATAELHVSQAVCWLHLGQPAAALEHCDRALALEAGHARAALFRGVALQQLGCYDAAYRAYDQALSPDQPQQTTAVGHQPQLKALLKRQWRKVTRLPGKAVLH